MPIHWAIDLGTTNTIVAMEEGGSARVVPLPHLVRAIPTEQSPLIPSAVHLTEDEWRWLWLRWRRQRPVIGQQALDRNFDGQSPSFAQGFKPDLAHQPHRPILRVNGRMGLTSRDAARIFLQELLRALSRHFHIRPRDVTVPAPVGYSEHYRAEIRDILRRSGVRQFRSLDEPVAAALGYGVNVAREETLLVVDFGGGTLDLAVVRLGPQAMTTGKAEVIAKHMLHLGGRDVDQWLVESLVPDQGHDLPGWRRDLYWEAMFVKELVSREGRAEFRWGGFRQTVERRDLVDLMAARGLYRQLQEALSETREQLMEFGITRVDQVLLVGGSTLLPEVPAVVDEAFPDAVVRHDPEFVFASVALGAARFAGGAPLDDFLYHDYALAVQGSDGRSVEYELLVPRRSRYPTPPEALVRYYADYPGMAEVRFSVCEIGRLGQARAAWHPRANGNRYWKPDTDEERMMVVELNPGDATLPLRPAGQGISARLRVTYAIDDDRWLRTTVEDLVRKQVLRDKEPVVRLR
jgi:molecular chaperone DnaK (HSP70)